MNALLRNNSNPNDQTADGHRVLQLAIKAGFEAAAKVLINSGAEVDTKDRSGLTPFQAAVLQENKQLADFLISSGARRQPPPGIDSTKYYKLYNEPKIGDASKIFYNQED